jgi:CubicO group peptidase (beta-lactamase class C family)
MRRLGTLPLMHQPGERWQYQISHDVLSVLVARVTGQSFETFLRERVFDPLGMKDTAFHVPADKMDRLPPLYAPDPQTGQFNVWDEAKGGRWSSPPAFQGSGGGLVSTVDDYHAYFQMLLNGGMHGSERILSRLAVQLMTTNRLTPEQQAADTPWLSTTSICHSAKASTVAGASGWRCAPTAATTRPSASSAGTAEAAPRPMPTRTTSSPESCSPRSG